MKIPFVPKQEPVVKVPVSFKTSTADLLVQYQACYAATYSDSISRSDLIELIVRNQMDTDKGFLAFLKKKAAEQSVATSGQPSIVEHSES